MVLNLHALYEAADVEIHSSVDRKGLVLSAQRAVLGLRHTLPFHGGRQVPFQTNEAHVVRASQGLDGESVLSLGVTRMHGPAGAPERLLAHGTRDPVDQLLLCLHGEVDRSLDR